MPDKPDIWLLVMSWLSRHIPDVLCRDLVVLDRLLARDLRRKGAKGSNCRKGGRFTISQHMAAKVFGAISGLSLDSFQVIPERHERGIKLLNRLCAAKFSRQSV